MNRIVIAASLAWGTCGFALPAFSAGGPQRARSVLADVRELEQRVTYTETKIPLGELVQKVSDDTGVPLSASPEVADEPVAVVVKEFPARMLLEQLADLLDYRWSLRREGARERAGERATKALGSTLSAQHSTLRYEIWQDLASRQREEAARQAIAADVEKRFQEEVTRAVAIAALPPEQIARLRDDLWARFRAQDKLPPEQWLAIANTPERAEQVERYQLARNLTSPVLRTLALLVGRLTRAQWDRLRAGEPLLLSTAPEPGELRLPAETSRALRAAKPTLFPPLIWPGLRARLAEPGVAERVQQRERELQDQWAAATGYRVTIWLDPLGGREGAVLSLRTSATAIRGRAPDGKPWPGGNSVGAPGTDFYVSSSAVDRWQRDRENTPERQAALAQDPVLGARKPFRPEAKPPVASPGSADPPFFTFRDLLSDLARAYGVHFISDAYSAIGVLVSPASLSSPEPAALFALLDRWAWSTHRWDRVGNLIRLRCRHWFWDRPREIPLRLVRRWKASYDGNGALSLDEYVAIARGLADAQLATVINPGVLRETGLSSEIRQVVTARYALRLYGALNPAQRKLLWQGAALPFLQMTPLQRELFAASLRDPWRNRFVLIRPQPLAAGSLSLTVQPFLRTTVKRGGIIYRQSTEPLPPGYCWRIRSFGWFPRSGQAREPIRATVRSLASSWLAERRNQPNERIRQQYPPGTGFGLGERADRAASGGPSSAVSAPPEEVIRRPVTEVTFVFQCGSGKPDTVRLTVTPVAN